MAQGRKIPTWVTHFTHIDHLETVIRDGLLSDSRAHELDVLQTEVGEPRIKDRRRARAVPGSGGGTVADYVPFYFAPRSPMLYSISMGNVPTYGGGTGRLIYLLTTLERLQELGHHVMLTDRNAALGYAEYRKFDPADQIDDGFIDWPLMKAERWNNTLEEPQRMERRMAEALVHNRVDWEAVTGLGVKSKKLAEEVREILTRSSVREDFQIYVRPEWYF